MDESHIEGDLVDVLFTEADIHTVIPNRPRKPAAKSAPPPQPQLQRGVAAPEPPPA